MILWAKRWNVAHGVTWSKERSVTPDTAENWLAIFQKDEPEIEFRLSDKKPRVEKTK